ncbi:MAG: AAA domain (dynein-related subfamily) [Candidatus Methanofastidiosum methylothiophilum]|uniref:AAA domain (Dynein-related subfamily) n=1 Tax=Candidatus Methanofastidiosum methylothiophilum TaxID=1705564 RepID=A0A150IH58_9EURY|nr:MAG: AAA domain (dynein-related subfamily) [Candidatus Methanofastidiosum methylthiophilus]
MSTDLREKIIKIISNDINNEISSSRRVSGFILAGLPGTGKTHIGLSLANMFEKMYFIQCREGISDDNLLREIWLDDNGSPIVKKGKLITAAKQAAAGQKVLLIIDELDKSRLSVDYLFLEILQNEIISGDNEDIIIKNGKGYLCIIFTTNEKRRISEPLLRRCRFFRVKFPERNEEVKRILEIAKINNNHLAAVSAANFFVSIASKVRDIQNLYKYPSSYELGIALRDLILGVLSAEDFLNVLSPDPDDQRRIREKFNWNTLSYLEGMLKGWSEWGGSS